MRGTAKAFGRQCEGARDVGASDEVMLKNNDVFGLCKVFFGYMRGRRRLDRVGSLVQDKHGASMNLMDG